jgi:integrase/recombinase XerD
MDESIRTAAISPLRQRLIDDMNMRRFSRETQRNYIRDVGRFATFLGRSPHTATTDDLRRFQIEQREAGLPTPTMNSIVSALRFFFTNTLDRPDLARKLVRVAHPRNTARGAQPGGGGATARRDHQPQVPSRPLRCLWRWSACVRSGRAQGR